MMDNKDKIMKYNMFDVCDGIKLVYGYDLFNKFISYIKTMYGLDKCYHYSDIITDVLYEDEFVLNINVFFDSEDERHISEIGIKDIDNTQLLEWLNKNCNKLEI